MEGQLVRLDQLPSKGAIYPEDIEIYVKPLTIKEQMDMERYGISQAEYYTQAVQGITIRGDFDRNDLLFIDVQFLDLVRVLYTFDVNNEIEIKNYPCLCGSDISYKFRLDEIEYTDIDQDIFGENNEGTPFEFSDGLTIYFRPFTVDEYIRASRKYISNTKTNVGNIYFIYMTLCAYKVKDRVFKDDKTQFEFIKGYLENLSKFQDRNKLIEIEEKCASVPQPFTTICPNCGEEVKVILSPHLRFQQ